jgi:hypothetical protein
MVCLPIVRAADDDHQRRVLHLVEKKIYIGLTIAGWGRWCDWGNFASSL